jgi:membrane protein
MKKKRFEGVGKIFKNTWKGWNEDDPFRQSAVIAYYAIFSLPALLVLVVNLAGLFFGTDVVSEEIFRQIEASMGKETAEQVGKIIEKAQQTKAGVIAGTIAVATILFGATGVFVQIQKSLNQIWDVQQKKNAGFKGLIKSRLLSFGLILSIGFLLLISMVVSTALSAFSEWLKARFPDTIAALFFVVEFAISFGIISLLFAAMFKVLPDVKVPWRSIWIGSFVTGFLFMLGKYGLSIYFGKAEPASVYGAAGSIVLILLWVSYSSMIVFFGAEFTKQYAVYHDMEIVPSKNAEMIEPETKKKDLQKLENNGEEKAVEKNQPEKTHSFAARRRLLKRLRKDRTSPDPVRKRIRHI